MSTGARFQGVELPAVEKRYLDTMIGGPGGRRRRECWSATTTDGVWSIERQEMTGTPWEVFHHPTQRSAGLVPSLRKGQVWIATRGADWLATTDGSER